MTVIRRHVMSPKALSNLTLGYFSMDKWRFLIHWFNPFICQVKRREPWGASTWKVIVISLIHYMTSMYNLLAGKNIFPCLPDFPLKMCLNLLHSVNVTLVNETNDCDKKRADFFPVEKNTVCLLAVLYPISCIFCNRNLTGWCSGKGTFFDFLCLTPKPWNTKNIVTVHEISQYYSTVSVFISQNDMPRALTNKMGSTTTCECFKAELFL